MKNIIITLLVIFIIDSAYSQKIILHRNSGGDQTYHTVLIGTLCWMKENLNVGTMINGSLNQTNNTTIEKYCYNNDAANCTIYGGLYQWDEAMQYVNTEEAQGLCPDGWHIPSQNDHQILKTTVMNDGNALKEIGHGNGTNTSGFSALLTGARYIDGAGYGGLGTETYFWNSDHSGTLGYYLYLNSSNSNILLYSTFKGYGFSVRCIKD